MKVGIIGAGQLGQMLGFAASELGAECIFIDPSAAPPATGCGTILRREFDDAQALQDLADQCDVITYEFENVPVEALQHVVDRVPVHPPAAALRHAQDRLDEKRLFEKLGIPLPRYRPVDTRDDLEAAVANLGLPMVVKTRRLGYDGKGQVVVEHNDQVRKAWDTLGRWPLIAEQWVAFDFEVSCIGVRNRGGDVSIYPLSHNVHSGGILRTSISPVIAPLLEKDASDYTTRLLNDLDYVGALALELFVINGEILANEFAPRVHNSGHWTIEGSATSQFENHLRAVLGLPLGSTVSRGHAGMVNLIGEIPAGVRSLDIGTLHDYGKAPRPGRKLGHVTVVADSAAQRDRLVEQINESVT